MMLDGTRLFPLPAGTVKAGWASDQKIEDRESKREETEKMEERTTVRVYSSMGSGGPLGFETARDRGGGGGKVRAQGWTFTGAHHR